MLLFMTTFGTRRASGRKWMPFKSCIIIIRVCDAELYKRKQVFHFKIKPGGEYHEKAIHKTDYRS
jgi:hypothetical protein